MRQGSKAYKVARIAARRAVNAQQTCKVHHNGARIVLAYDVAVTPQGPEKGPRMRAQCVQLDAGSAAMARRAIELFEKGWGHRPGASPETCMRTSLQYAQAIWSAANRRMGRRL
jgi:hypothetical protein